MGTFVQVPIIVSANYADVWTQGLISYPNYRVALSIGTDQTTSLAVAFRVATGEYPLRMLAIGGNPNYVYAMAALGASSGEIAQFNPFATNVIALYHNSSSSIRYFPHTSNDLTIDYPEPFTDIQEAYEQLSNTAAPEGFRNIRYNVTGAIVTGPSYLSVGDTANIYVSPNIGSTVTANNIEVIQGGNKIPFTYSNNRIVFTVP